MPAIEDIERLNTELIAISDEPRKSADWGEKIELVKILKDYPIHTEGAQPEFIDDNTGEQTPEEMGSKAPPRQTEIDRLFNSINAAELRLDTLPDDDTAGKRRGVRVKRPAAPVGAAPVDAAPAGAAPADEAAAGTEGEDAPLEDVPSLSSEPAASGEGGGGDESEIEDYGISEEDLHRLNESLERLPPQLKQRIENIMSDSGVTSSMIALVIDQLIAGESPRKITETVSRLEVGFFQPRTRGGLRGSRAREAWSRRAGALMPIAASIGVLLLLFVSWQFVYRPISAELLTSRGIQAINVGNDDQAEVLFIRAQRQYQSKRNILRYAREYRDINIPEQAGKYYETLVETYPLFRPGAQEFALYDAYEVGNFTRAVNTLQEYTAMAHPARGIVAARRQILENLGDIYILWGDEEGGTSADAQQHYSSARYHYALIIDRFGLDNNVLSRMARYFIRTDNQPEIADITEALTTLSTTKNIEQALRRKQRLQRISQRYRDPAGRQNRSTPLPLALVELLGYHVDAANLNQAATLVAHPLLSTGQIPEYYYHAARYHQIENNFTAAQSAWQTLLLEYQKDPPRYRRDRRTEVLAYRDLGHRHLGNSELPEALRWFDLGIERYQDGLAAGGFVRRPEFGSLYAGRGDTYYRSETADEQALIAYQTAREHLYDSPDLRYRMANIFYRRNEFSSALPLFNSIVTDSTDPNAALALANTLYESGAYGAAVGYYNEVIDTLEIDRSVLINIDTARRPAHRAIIERLITAYNNAGVGYERLAQRQGTSSYRQLALAYLTTAGELLSQYRLQLTSRVQQPTPALSGAPLPATTVPEHNNYVLSHNRAAELITYSTIPRDLAVSTTDPDSARPVTLSAEASPADPRQVRIESP